jgi:hypothetical protein
MSPLRRVLGPIAAAWLLCQMATLGLAPSLLLWVGSAGASLMECTCSHGADATCPMHHHKPASGAKPCVMQSTNGNGAAVLASVLGLLGFLPQETPGLALTSLERTMLAEIPTGIDRPAPPDPPPPRG